LFTQLQLTVLGGAAVLDANQLACDRFRHIVESMSELTLAAAEHHLSKLSTMQDLELQKILAAGAVAPLRLTSTPAWHGHIPFAFWCIEMLKPKTFVELGTHKGDSYCAFCQAVTQFGSSTTCYAVDTWQGDKHSALYDNSIFEELSRYHDERYGAFSQLVRATFDEASENFAAGSIDLLHIDGLHTYEAVKHDFETWLPKLSDRAVVLLHDITVREKDFGVWKFWEELKTRYPHFAFTHSHGLGVVSVGKDSPLAIKALCNLSTQEADRVRATFASLGAAVLTNSENQSLRLQCTDAITASEKRAHYLETSQRQFADLLGKFNQRDALLAESQNRIKVLDTQLKTAEKQRRTTLEDLSADLSTSKKEQDGLLKELAYMRNSLSWKITGPMRKLVRLLKRGR
jgi:hypothetical protein